VTRLTQDPFAASLPSAAAAGDGAAGVEIEPLEFVVVVLLVGVVLVGVVLVAVLAAVVCVGARVVVPAAAGVTTRVEFSWPLGPAAAAEPVKADRAMASDAERR
jgi:hypothetical protein